MPATPAIDPTACLAGCPESSAPIEAAPEETPSSNSVMVSIRNLAIRPTPLCIGCFESCGVAEPVRINLSLIHILFEGTVADNIAYGCPDATREQVIEAAKRAHAHKFIVQLPGGYDTVIGCLLYTSPYR